MVSVPKKGLRRYISMPNIEISYRNTAEEFILTPIDPPKALSASLFSFHLTRECPGVLYLPYSAAEWGTTESCWNGSRAARSPD